MSSEMYHREVW